MNEKTLAWRKDNKKKQDPGRQKMATDVAFKVLKIEFRQKEV